MNGKGVFFNAGRRPLFPFGKGSKDSGENEPEIEGQAMPDQAAAPQPGQPAAPHPAPGPVRTIGGVPLDWPDENQTAISATAPWPAQQPGHAPVAPPMTAPVQAPMADQPPVAPVQPEGQAVMAYAAQPWPTADPAPVQNPVSGHQPAPVHQAVQGWPAPPPEAPAWPQAPAAFGEAPPSFAGEQPAAGPIQQAAPWPSEWPSAESQGFQAAEPAYGAPAPEPADSLEPVQPFGWAVEAMPGWQDPPSPADQVQQAGFLHVEVPAAFDADSFAAPAADPGPPFGMSAFPMPPGPQSSLEPMPADAGFLHVEVPSAWNQPGPAMSAPQEAAAYPGPAAWPQPDPAAFAPAAPAWPSSPPAPAPFEQEPAAPMPSKFDLDGWPGPPPVPASPPPIPDPAFAAPAFTAPIEAPSAPPEPSADQPAVPEAAPPQSFLPQAFVPQAAPAPAQAPQDTAPQVQTPQIPPPHPAALLPTSPHGQPEPANPWAGQHLPPPLPEPAPAPPAFVWPDPPQPMEPIAAPEHKPEPQTLAAQAPSVYEAPAAPMAPEPGAGLPAAVAAALAAAVQPAPAPQPSVADSGQPWQQPATPVKAPAPAWGVPTYTVPPAPQAAPAPAPQPEQLRQPEVEQTPEAPAEPVEPVHAPPAPEAEAPAHAGPAHAVPHADSEPPAAAHLDGWTLDERQDDDDWAYSGGASPAPLHIPIPGMEDVAGQTEARWLEDPADVPAVPDPELTQDQKASYEKALEESLERLFSANRSFRWKKVGELLRELGLLSDEDLHLALHEQQLKRRPLGQILVEMGLISDRLLLKVLAAQKDVRPWFFDKELNADLLAMLEPDFCLRCQLLPVDRTEDTLVLAMRNPADIDSIDYARQTTGLKVEPVLPDEAALANKIEEAFSRDARSHQAHVNALVQEAIKVADFRPIHVDDGKSVQALEEETRPVTGIVNKIISDGIKMRASDIHLEPTSTTLQVRYRIDGRLHKVNDVPKELNAMISARVKIMAELDPVEWRLPQDGRIGVVVDGKQVDLRVSILPSFYGGRIVMRILDRTIGLKRLEDIGFSQNNLLIFKTLIQRPYGLFLVTGPTGSGKTTSLYAALNYVKDEETNIITCEDPVEYNIDGISQSQVNTKIGLTFAQQLRSILRQDPDVVLVGEIRDHETAETAIRASMTGHLVFSTLHCNDAPSAVPRLLDMNIDPYLLSTSLIGVMGQRLLRRTCKECCRAYKPNAEEMVILQRTFGLTDVDHLYKGAGCMNCSHTGFRGRFAVHEIMPSTQELTSYVAARAPTEKLGEIARHYGYRTMQEDAMERVLKGETTLKEAQRLLAFDDIPRVDGTKPPEATA